MQSIAILPFKNISEKTEYSYLCSAIPIEITHLLTKQEKLKIISVNRISPLSEVPDYYKKLNADLLMEGTLLASDNQVRITIQIISGKNSTCLFSSKFDEPTANLFKLLDNISAKIIRYLNLELIENKIKIDSNAYNYYLKGVHHWNLWDENNIEKAISLFEKSIKIEPEFALAYARLSNCWSLLAGIQKGNILKNYSTAKTAALKAMKLNSSLIEAHLSLALIKLINDVDISGAFYSFQMAFTINNHSSETHYYYSFYLLVIGEYKKALKHLKYALNRNPFNIQMNSTYGFALLLASDYEGAKKQLKKTLSFAPDSDASYDALFWVYMDTKEYALAKKLIIDDASRIMHSPAAQVVLYHRMALKEKKNEWMKKVVSNLNKDTHKTHYREASIAYLNIEALEKGMSYLELFYKERIGFIMVLTHPAWKTFRESRKFYKYKKRLNLLRPPILSDEFPQIDREMIVIASSTKEELSINISDLLYIEAQNIYSKVVWKKDEEVKETFLRVALSKIIDQTINHQLYRCHNSFIINTNIPYQIKGNRKSMKLTLKEHTFEIPVSRNKASNIHKHLKTDIAFAK